MIRFRQRLSLLALASLFISGCGSDSNTNTTIAIPPPPPAIDISSLQTFTNMFTYDQNSSIAMPNQFTFNVAAPANLTAMQVIFYEQDNCSMAATEISSNSNSGVSLAAGSYSTNAAANYAICSNFSIPGYTGCDGLFKAEQSGVIKSMRYLFYYTNGTSGNATFSQCVNSGASSYELYNYDNNTSCTQGGATCGYSQGYNYALSSEGYKHLIFLSDATYSGNLGGFSGADAKCNTDVNKPIADANITYKALLNGNGATVLNVDYYTANGSSLIATATGVNLVGYSGLTNPISSTNSRVWTGADTNKDCSNWTQGDTATGSYGLSNELGGSYYGGFVQFCSSSAKLYCVAQ